MSAGRVRHWKYVVHDVLDALDAECESIRRVRGDRWYCPTHGVSYEQRSPPPFREGLGRSAACPVADFAAKVWAELAKVPDGEVST